MQLLRRFLVIASEETWPCQNSVNWKGLVHISRHFKHEPCCHGMDCFFPMLVCLMVGSIGPVAPELHLENQQGDALSRALKRQDLSYTMEICTQQGDEYVDVSILVGRWGSGDFKAPQSNYPKGTSALALTHAVASGHACACTRKHKL